MYMMSDPKKRPSEAPKPARPKNKADVRAERKAAKEKKEAEQGMVMGEKIVPTTPEMLKKMFGH